LIFVLGAVLIVGSIAIGGWLQSSPTAPIEVAAAICDQTQPSPTPKATTAALAATPAPKATTTPAGQQAAAPAKADAKELPKTVASADLKGKSANAAAPAATPMTHAAAPAPEQKVAAAAVPVALSGDAAAGHQVFRKCQACHSIEPGKNGLGPSLAGIVGEKAAAVPGYSFSPAMKASNLTWDAATLDAYLTDPQKVVPGN